MRPIPAPIIRSVSLSSCLLALAIGLGSCAMDHARYPDPTGKTRIQTDDIRAQASRRQDKIDTDLAQQERTLDFRVNQTKATATREREQLLLDRDQEVQPLTAEAREAKEATIREGTRIDAELETKLKTADGTETDRLRTEATSRKATIDLKRSEDAAKLEAKRAKAEAKLREKTISADEREAKNLDGIERERDELVRKARADRLEVDAETAKRLDEIAKDGKERMETSNAVAHDRLRQDREVDKAIRSTLDRDREASKNVSFTTRKGVVTLDGTFADEQVHRDLISRIYRIDGVVSIEDRLRTP